MGQRKNKLTKKQRKSVESISNEILFNMLIDDDIETDDPNDPHYGPIHYTDFVCSSCGTHKDIPTHIIMDNEFWHEDETDYTPSFPCDKCNHKMYPTYFKGYLGKIYEYKLKD